MWEDPIVTEVRQIREKLAKQFDFEVHAVFVDLRTKQSQLGSRLVRLRKREKVAGGSESDQNRSLLHPGK